jgi:hypothetical protein
LIQLQRRLPQPVGHSTRLVLDSSGRRNLATSAESATLHPENRGRYRGCHRRRDGNKLPFARPCTYHRSKKTKKLTNEIVVHANICVKVGNAFPRRRLLPDLCSSFQGGLGSASAGRLCALRQLARSGRGRPRSQRRLATVGDGSLRTPPRSLRPSLREPDDCPALLRSILAILVHHCRHNSSNIPSVRKHSQVMSHARCKKVFASRAGDRNILRPSTPGNLQHPRRRLPELGRRHPSPRGRACPHQLHSKTIGDPQFSHRST